MVAVVVAAIWMGWREANKHGHFPLRGIHLEGTVQISSQQILKLLALRQGVNLLRLDPNQIREQLLSLPWVRSAKVKRVFPGTLVITLAERTAVCLGLKGERLYLLDEYGLPIKPFEVADPLLLPLVTPPKGEDPGSKVVWLVNLLGKHAWLKERISQAAGYTGGRWILYTREGVKLFLSEDADKELALLHRVQDKYGILDREIRQVELRIPGRIAVRSAL